MERGVIVTLDNGTLGRTQGTESGIFAMMLYGYVALDADTFVQPIYSLKDAIDLGINPDIPDPFVGQAPITLESNDYAYQQIAAFYSFPENVNKKLYIKIIPQTVPLSQIVDINGPYAADFLNATNGELRMLFVGGKRIAEYDTNLTKVSGLDSQVWIAVQKAQALAELYAQNEVSPFRVVLDGYSFSGIASQLLDLTTLSANRVAINLAADAESKSSCLGLLAGKLAHIPVNESAGWVAAGNLPIEVGYLTSGIPIENNRGQINEILDKGYISFQKYPHKYGYFFCNPRMATALTDDYKALSDGRTIDKAHILAYQVFVNYVNSQLYITSKGTLNILQVRAMEADIENTITQQMIAKGECSFVKCVIDPTQKVISTNELIIGVKIIPTATLELLKVKLGFAQSI